MAINGRGSYQRLLYRSVLMLSLPHTQLISALDELEKMDKQIEKQFGQDVIDSFSVLEAVVPTFHESLWPKFREVFPMIILALRSRFAIIRQAAAKCFATMCDTVSMDAMRTVIEDVIPFLGDDLNLSNRQGATELIYRMYTRVPIPGDEAYLCYRHRAEIRHEGTAIRHLHGRPRPG